MANPPQPPKPGAPPQPPASAEPDPDLLAAVVLHTLVSRAGTAGRTREGHARGGMTLAEVALACERDPADPADRSEVRGALEILLADELAICRDELWRATRAAVRAAELSF